MVRALLIMGEKSSLKYLPNDIELLKTAFSSIGIAVSDISGDKNTILPILGDTIDNLGSMDTLIIYYTGHGYLNRGRICFKVGTGNLIKDSLSVNEIIEYTSNSNSTNIILIFDCCYATGSEIAWKQYADDRHLLFLPSNKLEAVEELEEYQSSFFTYCIYSAITSKPESVYEDGKITLKSLFTATKQNAIQYNYEKGTKMPLPELIGTYGKEIILGFAGKQNKEEIDEQRIAEYLSDFMYCIDQCENTCYENQKWCTTIFKSDTTIMKYVVPTVKEFLSDSHNGNIAKLNAFFDMWFTNQNNYLGVLGDMGVGKTSACIYLFYYLAKNYFDHKYSYVPVFFSLSAIKERLAQEKDIYTTIQSFMSDKLNIEIIKKLSHNGRIVFILDGFDEISGDSSTSAILHNFEMLKPIMRFGCKTVLTCRTHYFSEQDQLEEVLIGNTQGTDFAATLLHDQYPFNIVELQEFTESEILEVISLLLPNEDNKKFGAVLLVFTI